ncbi:MAG: ABC transporter substrate-binding protein, partial [Gammaproteobacteria bacterium]
MAKKHNLRQHKDAAQTNAHLPDVIDSFNRKRISRREFMQMASALGMSAAAVYGFAGVTRPAFAQNVRRGGTFRIDSPLQDLNDPQLFSWIEGSNVTRGLCEYLTHYGHDGVVKPYLAERWNVSADGKTVDLFLRKGVMWSNGDEFNADDVMHNFNRWRVEGNTSINNSEWGDGVMSAPEKVNSHQVRLHLTKPDVSVAHRLYAYPTQLVHRSFDDTGADLKKNAISTGPFSLKSFSTERAEIVRRPGYWGGPDGLGDAYLDSVLFVNLGEDEQAPISALASGQIDWMYKINPKQLDAVRSLSQVQVLDTDTAQTPVLRFACSDATFKDKENKDYRVSEIDVRVREAIQLAANNADILRIAYANNGAAGDNHHTSRTQPDYADVGKQRQDLERARQLIQEAGMENKPVNITLGNTQGSWETDVCQVLQEQCKKAGINLQLQVLPQDTYWEGWDKSDFGLTFWTDRPLAVMLHKLAYRSDAKWNEARFKSQKYDDALDAAAASPDAETASKHMKVCQQELLDNHVMVQPLFLKLYTGGKAKVQNFPRHPAEFYPFHRLWMEA